MKDTMERSKVSCDIRRKSKIKDFWDKQIVKLKKGSFTCPLCKEGFTGLAALGTHFKDHCT